jgi:hypothetical protein
LPPNSPRKQRPGGKKKRPGADWRECQLDAPAGPGSAVRRLAPAQLAFVSCSIRLSGESNWYDRRVLTRSPPSACGLLAAQLSQTGGGGRSPPSSLFACLRAAAYPGQLEAPPARGHAAKSPVPPGAPCPLFLRPSSIGPPILVSAHPVRVLSHQLLQMGGVGRSMFAAGGRTKCGSRARPHSYPFTPCI